MLLERARLAVKRGDRGALSDSVARLGELDSSWPARRQQFYRDFEQETTAKSQRSPAAFCSFATFSCQHPEFRKDLWPRSRRRWRWSASRSRRS